LNCERLHRFADISSVDGFLDELANKPTPMVLKLPRAPGEREARWAHLLCGQAAVPAARVHSASANTGADTLEANNGANVGANVGADVSAAEWVAIKAEQTRLAAEVDALKALVQRMAQELGMTS
jgi:uncharacterized protein